MELLLYYNQKDALAKANEIANEANGTVESSSYDKIYDCRAMDEKAEELLNNSVSGETGAYHVYDENLDRLAVVAFWES